MEYMPSLYPPNHPNVGIYSMHGVYGDGFQNRIKGPSPIQPSDRRRLWSLGLPVSLIVNLLVQGRE